MLTTLSGSNVLRASSKVLGQDTFYSDEVWSHLKFYDNWSLMESEKQHYECFLHC